MNNDMLKRDVSGSRELRASYAELVEALDLFVHAYETSATPETLSGNLNSIVIDKARAALATSRGQR